MQNLHVSFPKITMLILLALSIIYSCTTDDIVLNYLEQDIAEDSTFSGVLISTSHTTDTVIEEPSTDNCASKGGLAGDTGLKIWCWGDIEIPDYLGSKGVSFSNNQLVIDSECFEKQITNSGSELKFLVNPINPGVGDWCSKEFNMRAEIRTAPWQVKNPLGTEEWFGWTLRLGKGYIIDIDNQWKFFQVYPGPSGLSPQISLEVINNEQFNGHEAGEIYVVNNEDPQRYNPTGITPNAGESLDIVVHVIWHDANQGLLQVWINGKTVYDKQVATVSPDQPWGGNAKWGIYKWPWAKASGVQKSLDHCITNLETYIGPLRMITRNPNEVDYLKNSFSIVSPNQD